MFGWRRRNDGFEWREYVRTTILVRRKDRRERIERAGKAAVEGVKVAGQRGAEVGAIGAQAIGRGAKVAGQRGVEVGAMGAQALGRGAMAAGQAGAIAGLKGAQAIGRGAKIAGQQGLAWGAAGVRAAASSLRSGAPKVWDALSAAAAWMLAVLAAMWAAVRIGTARSASAFGYVSSRAMTPVGAAGARVFEPLGATLRQRAIALPLTVAGTVAFLGCIWLVATRGFTRDALVPLLIGAAILIPVLLARSADGGPLWLAASGMRGLGAALLRLAPAAATPVLVLVVAAGAYFAWSHMPRSTSFVSAPDEDSAVEGRAVALSGEMLRVGRTTLRISGIEAPADGQVCTSPRARRWRCDEAAQAALSRLVRGERVACTFAGSDDGGIRLATCHNGEKDLGAELVRNGHVFATEGLFAPYGTLELEARDAKVGVWAGDAVRPANYRAQKWEEAKREAPDGCPIKGVRRGERVYVLPWSRGYDRVHVSRARGDRWFCSEEEAREAGWKPSEQS
jgi:endonuclease YncB( thermonuclease family)